MAEVSDPETDLCWYRAELTATSAEVDRLRVQVEQLYEDLRVARGNPSDGERRHLTRAVLLAKELTLTRQERHSFAELVLDRAGSWSGMPELEAARLADALSGFLPLQAILMQRPR